MIIPIGKVDALDEETGELFEMRDAEGFGQRIAVAHDSTFQFVPSKMNTYPFSLRANLIVNLVLPEDLTHHEADRLASAIKTFPFGQ